MKLHTRIHLEIATEKNHASDFLLKHFYFMSAFPEILTLGLDAPAAATQCK